MANVRILGLSSLMASILVLSACGGSGSPATTPAPPVVPTPTPSPTPAPTPAPSPTPSASRIDPYWANATIYFMMTDRFANGDPTNDTAVGRKKDGGMLRSFEGGDIRGIIDRIKSGYFTDLGTDAIWTTPLIENVHGSVGEGEYGKTYAYHGYWPKDWTKVDPAFGTEADLAEMVREAHARGIRVISDVIMNHSGPQTEVDERWPADWVRPGPACDYKSFALTVTCELVFTLPDIRTESEAPVALPQWLIDKWRAEGRLDTEQAELDAFFARTGYPRAPKYYLIKWLTDWVRDYGIDGFRVDTAKHVDPDAWAALRKEAELALADWRARNPNRIMPDKPFYMVGEVFNWGIDNFSQARGRAYDYGDRQVDFYTKGFDALINMGFPTQATRVMADQFATAGAAFDNGAFAGVGILNYISSHDDMGPYDGARTKTFESANRLMLSTGAAQIYYGDEVGRSLVIPGTTGDATLRSMFDWSQTQSNAPLLAHWRKLAKFRQAHPAVGAGTHREIARGPFVFSRTLDRDGASDKVVVAVDVTPGTVRVPVGGTFADGETLLDSYSGARATVSGGAVSITTSGPVILLAKP